MSDKKIVTFKKEWRGYAIGETAGFDVEAASALVDSGRAKFYVSAAVAEKPAAAPAAKKTVTKKAGKSAEGPTSTEPLEPVEPIEPVDLDDVVDPIDPIDPVDPVDLEELDEKP